MAEINIDIALSDQAGSVEPLSLLVGTPSSFPRVTVANPADTIVIDRPGVTTRSILLTDAIESVAPLATEAQAEAGANDVARMTPLKTRQAIEAVVGGVSLWRLPTVGDIATVSVPAPITVISVLGYSEEGDGGASNWTLAPVQAAGSGKRQSADGRWWQITEAVLSPKMFGAVGDGVASDSAYIAEMFDFAPEKAKIVFPAGTYKCTTSVSTAKELFVDARGAKFQVSANVTPFVFRNPWTETAALTVDYAAGALSITVGAGLATGIRPGETFKIFSNAHVPGDRDRGSEDGSYRTGEWVTAGFGSTSTNIVLQRPLRFTRGINPVSVAGDEAAVDSYTVAMNARVFRVPNKVMTWHGGEIAFDDGQAATWNANSFFVSGYNRPEINGLRITKGYSLGISFTGNRHGRIIGCHTENLEDNTTNGQYGYGIGDASLATYVENPSSYNVRHAYTSSVPYTFANDADDRRVLAAGRTVGGYVIGGYARGAGTAAVAPWDTHASSEDMTFVNCVAENCPGYGFSARGKNVTFIRPVTKNCAGGISVITEWASGDPDDDFAMNEKSVDAHTSAFVFDPDFDCDTLPPIFVSAAVCHFYGNGRYTSRSLRQITAAQASVVFTGRHRFFTKDGNITGGTTVGVQVDAVSGAWLGWIAQAGVRFAKESDVEFDMVPGTYPGSGYTMFGAQANTSIEFSGKMSAKLPAAFNKLFNSLGDIKSLDDGEVVITVPTLVGFTTNLTGRYIKVRSNDGAFLYNGTGLANLTMSQGRYLVDTIATHTGTGALVTNVFIPVVDTARLFNTGNVMYRGKLYFEKTGSAGAATIRINLHGAFVADVPLLAADRAGTIETTVYFRGASTQRCVVHSVINNGGGGAAVAGLWQTNETVNMAAAAYVLHYDVQAVGPDTIIFQAFEHSGTFVG